MQNTCDNWAHLKGVATLSVLIIYSAVNDSHYNHYTPLHKYAQLSSGSCHSFTCTWGDKLQAKPTVAARQWLSTCSAPSVRVITSPLCLPTTPESNNWRHSYSDVPVASLTTTTANYPTTLFTAHSSTLWDEQNAIYSRRRNTAMLQYNPSHPNALKLPSSLRKAVSASLGTSHR